MGKRKSDMTNRGYNAAESQTIYFNTQEIINAFKNASLDELNSIEVNGNYKGKILYFGDNAFQRFSDELKQKYEKKTKKDYDALVAEHAKKRRIELGVRLPETGGNNNNNNTDTDNNSNGNANQDAQQPNKKQHPIKTGSKAKSQKEHYAISTETSVYVRKDMEAVVAAASYDDLRPRKMLHLKIKVAEYNKKTKEEKEEYYPMFLSVYRNRISVLKAQRREQLKKEAQKPESTSSDEGLDVTKPSEPSIATSSTGTSDFTRAINLSDAELLVGLSVIGSERRAAESQQLVNNVKNNPNPQSNNQNKMDVNYLLSGP